MIESYYKDQTQKIKHLFKKIHQTYPNHTRNQVIKASNNNISSKDQNFRSGYQQFHTFLWLQTGKIQVYGVGMNLKKEEKLTGSRILG